MWMNRVLIGVALICIITGLAAGYLIGYITNPKPEDKGQLWATLSIDAGGGTWNYTAEYKVYWLDGTLIPRTTVYGPSELSLNITRPQDAPLGGVNGGWRIEARATVIPYNGNSPRPRRQWVYI